MLTKKSHLLLGIVVIVFLQAFQPILEPDLGWHIAVGRYIFQERALPRIEPFAFSAENHPYVAHSWLQDSALYLLEDSLGLWGINLWYGLWLGAIAFLIGYFFLRQKQTKSLFVIPLMLGLMVSFISLRTHLVTMFGLVAVYVLHKLGTNSKLENKRRFFLTVFLFFMWAQLHGGVVLGLVLMLLLSLVDLLQDRNFKVSKIQVLMLISVASVVLINPYGLDIYRFALNLGSSAMSQQFNQDWLPLLSPRLPQNTLILRLFLLGVSLWGLSRKGELKDKLLLLFALGMTLYSIRWSLLLWPFLLLSVIPSIFEDYAQRYGLKKGILYGILAAGLLFPISQIQTTWCVNSDPQCYAREGNYPYEAVTKLTQLSSVHRIYNHYTWGGYVVWHVPQQKIFIDGRMDNYQNGRLLEIFSQIESQNEGWEELLQELDPSMVLLPSSWGITSEIEAMERSEIISKSPTATLLLFDQ